MGKKYIVELKKNETLYKAATRESDGTAYVCSAIGTPYTEPDMEQVRKEAYEKGYETAKHECEECPKQAYTDALKMDVYQKGLSDAWEAARKIGSNSMCSLEEMGFDFSQCAVDDYNPSWFVVKNYSASEAIEKIRQYEQEKEELKKEQSFTAEEVMRQYLDTFCKGKSCTGCPLHTPDFTCGRGYHFLTNKQVSDEEVRKAYAAVLAKMKE